jgi:hypothetical protein
MKQTFQRNISPASELKRKPRNKPGRSRQEADKTMCGRSGLI